MYNGCQYTSPSFGTALTLSCIFPLIANIIYWMIGLAGTLALAMIIVSGVKFILSSGDAKSVEGAKKTLTFAIAGLLLAFFSFMILNFIAYVTGVACISNFMQGFTACK